MADIELVIKIPEELYGQLIELENPTYLAQCVINGKQLPKGHGRLIDADALPLNAIDDANYGSNYIRVAPTIIEADGEESITREEAIKTIKELMIACTSDSKYYKVGDMAIKALEQEPSGNLISRTEVRKFVEYIQSIKDKHNDEGSPINYGTICDLVIRGWKLLDDIKESLPPVNPQEPKTGQYEKHTDHTDCIWYGSDSGCPVTCSQYRDGWNDAMDYIFKNGKGYQPYRHDG